MADRGVSDVLGFILLFALVVTTVGVVTATGFSGLENARDAERLNNAERAFDVLADNMADITRHGAPSRQTTLQLADASLELAEPTTMRVTVEDNRVGGDPTKSRLVYEASTRPLVFASESGANIVYEGGAVIRTDSGRGTLVRAPPFVIDHEHTTIPYLVLAAGSGPKAIGGETTALVHQVKTGQAVLVQDQDDDVRVTLTIETASPRAPVWAAYVNEQADWPAADWSDSDTATRPCDTTDDGNGRSTVVCTFEPDEFYLTSTGVKIHLST